ncbi:VCBS repeat-containing protein [Hymenobacter gummosus]|uniref:VCBS repeat-containing protein n=1 Tax=Hymenobacter gummosus TaxID=1776032 RepID=A0A3S0JDL0_9BACT|nr:VCBS repeat-containing protein [Hymenobacter gummosus]RTQ53430.1 VCBS repeat-containing protein [Hymenobacter gummosus]
MTYPFTGDAYHAVAQDANADGYPDLLVAGGSWNHAVVLYNDRTGGFAAPQYFTCGDFCAGVAVAPVDCNSSPDLLMAVANDGRVEVLPTNGLGVFAPSLRQLYPVDGQPVDLVTGTFDNDAQVDFAALDILGGRVSVRLNRNGATCGGTFASVLPYPAGSGGLSAQTLRRADMNRDGRADVLVVNQAQPAGQGLSVLFGDGTGGFSAPTLSATGNPAPYDVAVGDLNGDGRPDAVVANLDDGNVGVLLGQAAAPWLGAIVRYPRPGAHAVALADFDRDGHLDVAVNPGGWILPGRGDGTLGPAQQVLPGGSGWLVAADFDGDGRPDLAQVASGQATLLRNPSIVLPVELVSFQATAGDAVHLRWTTASEVQNDGFEVQASGDGQRFDSLAWVPGQGTSSRAHTYTLVDHQPQQFGARRVYYRLRQQDRSGRTTYSPVQAVRWAIRMAAPFPNPCQRIFRVPGLTPTSEVELRTSLGQVAPLRRVGDQFWTAAVPGVYVLVVLDGARRLYYQLRLE